MIAACTASTPKHSNNQSATRHGSQRSAQPPLPPPARTRSFNMGPFLPGIEYILAAYAFGFIAPIPVLLANLVLIWSRLPRAESARILPLTAQSTDCTSAVHLVMPRLGLMMSLALSRRRRLIMHIILHLVSLTYVILCVWDFSRHYWHPFTGVRPDVILGTLAFSGLSVLSKWKRARGIDIWPRRSVKFSMIASVLCFTLQIIMDLIGVKVLYDHGRSK